MTKLFYEGDFANVDGRLVEVIKRLIPRKQQLPDHTMETLK